jgi:protoheme IX farnesyltransferase
VSLLPFVDSHERWLYLRRRWCSGGVFVAYAVRIYRAYSDALAQKTFRYSILYLAPSFAALLVDHYL